MLLQKEPAGGKYPLSSPKTFWTPKRLEGATCQRKNSVGSGGAGNGAGWELLSALVCPKEASMVHPGGVLGKKWKIGVKMGITRAQLAALRRCIPQMMSAGSRLQVTFWSQRHRGRLSVIQRAGTQKTTLIGGETVKTKSKLGLPCSSGVPVWL